MPLGRIRQVPRRDPSHGLGHCHCGIALDALIGPILDLDGNHRPLEWPIPRCETHEILLALPPSLQDCPWQPIFATDVHGYSLSNLQRRFEGWGTAGHDSPTLLIMAVVPKDEWKHVNAHELSTSSALREETTLIGAFVSDAPGYRHGAHDFYGTQESFVFHFPRRSNADERNRRKGGLQVHRWAEHCNSEFIISNQHFIGIGGGHDGAAIHISSDLQHATSSVHCETFDCGPLVAGNTHGLTHVELVVHRLWWFGIAHHSFAQLSAIPPSLLVAHPDDNNGDGDDDGVTGREPGEEEEPIALLREDEKHFHIEAFATPGCPCGASHHKCPYVEQAVHFDHPQHPPSTQQQQQQRL